MAAWMLILLGIVPLSDRVTDVDVIETNHFYDEQGRLVFTQFILWEWVDSDADFRVRHWIMADREGSPPPPQRSRDGSYYLLWVDSTIPWTMIRYVRANSLRETWTQYDPELVDREFRPKEARKALR